MGYKLKIMINIEELNQASEAANQSNATEKVFDNDNKRSVSINNRFMIFQDKGKKTQISLFLVKIYESLMKEDHNNIFKLLNIPGTDNFSRSYEFLKEADFIKTFLSSNVDLEDCIIRKNYELIMCLMIFYQHENMKPIVNEEQTELVKGLTELYLKNMKNFL